MLASLAYARDAAASTTNLRRSLPRAFDIVAVLNRRIKSSAVIGVRYPARSYQPPHRFALLQSPLSSRHVPSAYSVPVVCACGLDSVSLARKKMLFPMCPQRAVRLLLSRSASVGDVNTLKRPWTFGLSIIKS